MICPKCRSHAIRVYGTARYHDVGATGMVQRWRQCVTCGARWTTYEEYAHDVARRNKGKTAGDPPQG